MSTKCMLSDEKDDGMVCVVVSTQELRMGKKHAFETVSEEISKFPTSVGAFVIPLSILCALSHDVWPGF